MRIFKVIILIIQKIKYYKVLYFFKYKITLINLIYISFVKTAFEISFILIRTLKLNKLNKLTVT